MKISALALLAAFTSLAFGKSTEGDIAVTINGQTIDPVDDQSIKLEDVKPVGTIQVRGIHMQLDIDVATLGLRNYLLTGAVDDRRLVSKPTLIFVSKIPVFTPGTLDNLLLSEIEVRADQATLIFTCAGGKYKLQINDIATGGDLQIEPEMSGSATVEHVLGPNMFYFIDPDVGRILFTDGLGAVSQSQDPVNFHDMLLGKDSPEAATKTFQSGNVTRWSILPGGRVGQVLGHDALEGGVASNCTAQCQNQNQIHGSIPLPPDPTSPTPLPPRALRTGV
ncbi:hypothetical protein FPV67DRAFT_249884 [Lyophyllum atratum]|nr:hypothetical protein FPV67DRAFT_249884 [Lyophyllum atratum]